jgi:outer membrane lipoprotein-sorting protein
LLKAKARHVRHNYQPKTDSLVQDDDSLYIVRVHTNGNITIQLPDHVTQQMNICYFKLYKPEKA